MNDEQDELQHYIETNVDIQRRIKLYAGKHFFGVKEYAA